MTDDLDWAPLAAVLSAAEHPCRSVEVVVPPTPRLESPRVTEVRLFVAERVVFDLEAVVPLDDLYHVYRAWAQDLGSFRVDRERFARALREVLPAGAEMRRQMINGLRANRLVGARLR